MIAIVLLIIAICFQVVASIIAHRRHDYQLAYGVLVVSVVCLWGAHIAKDLEQ